MRLFVAINLPPPIRAELARIQNKLKESNICKGRYPHSEQAHLTLAFIKEVDRTAMDKIKAALATLSFPVVSAQLGNATFFERHGEIRIIYVEIICPELTRLAQQVTTKLNQWMPPTSHSFVSHVTLMRVERVHNKEKLKTLLQTIVVKYPQFTIDAFTLMESRLTPDGAHYYPITTYPLSSTN